jgi:hypothetical protein
MPREFHHTGVPTDQPQEEAIFIGPAKCWITDAQAHPNRIEWVRFEPDSPAPSVVKNQCHFGFMVDDLNAATQGEEVIFGPFEAMDGLTVVFIEKDGAVFEYLQFHDAE